MTTVGVAKGRSKGKESPKREANLIVAFRTHAVCGT